MIVLASNLQLGDRVIYMDRLTIQFESFIGHGQIWSCGFCVKDCVMASDQCM